VTAPRVPDLLVERLAKGDLPAEDAARVRARLEAEAGGLARLDALREDDRASLIAHPPGPAIAEIRRRAGLLGTPARRRRRTLLVLVPALGTAALAALLVLRLPGGPGPAAPRGGLGVELEETTVKGLSPRLALYRQRAGEPEALAPGAAVRAGDVVQVAYVGAGRAFGAILSVDGGGAVTVHLPAGSPVAAPLAKRGETTLDHAYVLDAAPAFERFFLLAAREPFPIADAEAALAGLAREGHARDGRPALPAGVELAEFLVVKAP
jgi:hypothetical protein